MRIPLKSEAGRVGLLVACLTLSAIFLGLAGKEFAAAYFAARLDLPSLQRAVQLSPGNASYRDQLGRYYWASNDWKRAEQSYLAAVRLNPHRSRYWLDLAATQRLLGETNAQQTSLESAISADPRTPSVAWEAANFYLAQGDVERFLQQSRVVLASDASLSGAALELAWRVRPDAEMILRDLLPPTAESHLAFLALLLSKEETPAAAQVWDRLVQINQPIERRHIFVYVQYLVAHKEVEQARKVWQQSARLSNLSAYQALPKNLLINSDFSLDILNGGFDWVYFKKADVQLALDGTQSHSGHRSLAVSFDRAKIDDAGIQQLVPVQPDTPYVFTAYFKAANIEGAGGPSLTFTDVYDGTPYWQSAELKDADFWKQVGGSFRTGPQTRLLVLRLARIPAGSPIKGKLWMDDLTLAPAGAP